MARGGLPPNDDKGVAPNNGKCEPNFARARALIADSEYIPLEVTVALVSDLDRRRHGKRHGSSVRSGPQELLLLGSENYNLNCTLSKDHVLQTLNPVPLDT